MFLKFLLKIFRFKFKIGVDYLIAGIIQKEINFYQEMETEHRFQENGKGFVPP